MSLSVSHAIIGQRFIYGRLSADSALLALGIYDDDVPSSVTYPLIQIRNTIPANNRVVIGDDIIYAMTRFLVVAIAEFRVGRPTWTTLVEPAGRIHQQLHQSSGSATGGQVERCSEISEYRQTYTHEGIYYRELGAFYDLWIQKDES